MFSVNKNILNCQVYYVFPMCTWLYLINAFDIWDIFKGIVDGVDGFVAGIKEKDF